jgi:hypothetical protein
MPILFLGFFAVIISVVWRKLIPVLVHTEFMIEPVHLIDIDKDKNDETKNRTLLRHPETEFESKKTNAVQNIDKQDRHSKRNQKPYR